MPREWSVGRLVIETTFFAASQASVPVALFYTLRYAISALSTSGSSDSNKKSKQKGQTILSKTGLSAAQLDDLQLDEYESTIAGEIIPPSSIDVTFESIGGLDEIIASLRETVIYPLTYPELFASANGLLSAPKGVLLYGHPGCGKTMLAKALAKESGATFINLPLSSLTNKWFGESNKLVAGLFSLARKVQPSIIFIDEVDSLFRERSSGDHEVTGMMKAEFMTLWDGLTTASDTRILVLGATNRPNDIDPAILRRMPKRFPIRLPNLDQRTKILSLMLSHTSLSPSFSISDLARRTDGLSGSDLRETCRNAAMAPVREVMREKGGKGKEGLEQARLEGFKLRPLEMRDFILHDSHAYAHVDPSRKAEPLSYGEPVD
ncbi:P-loop containing nucleoside triphosphate hydrolase protein [Dioszegia hungarica]|uniref:P-loop containing nucleoside triphosphate hydrolase protein n=1 Tax=Dioszegia hungarica TaxID=4972 RepID=A0AA38LTM0_9TREE|nr:P-loop containing nucleoside triphosphate hydrolase protein [Dioszegia hungarica]KAI9634920.1 P-loop containing nucleoside triphosphate hydrolase protein [Dioszegia hungarica]